MDVRTAHGLQISLLVFGLAACGEDASVESVGDVGSDSGTEDMSVPDSAGDPALDSSEEASFDAAEETTDDPLDEAALVTIEPGTVQGEVHEEYRVFRGIPFAAPPTGELRWRPPQPVEPWTETFDATRFGSQCIQPAVMGLAPTNANEDCLSLNVWTPNPVPVDAPVMLWIHGGGFAIGAGSQDIYDGDSLTQQGVILVTINYRMGALGFVAHEALTAEDDDHPASGNYGMMDQQAALQWVQENIEAFGGDPDNVTIFGESAGGSSVCLHLVMPRSAGLFHRAIIESGNCGFAPTLADAEADGVVLAEALDCDESDDIAACMRAVEPAAILNALSFSASFLFGSGVRWGPIEDGLVITAQPVVDFASGNYQQVPLLLGSNADEGTLFVALEESEFTEEDLTAFLDTYFADDAEAIAAEYPLEDYDTVNDAVALLAGEAFFNCPTRALARAVSASVDATYLYHFEREVNFPIFDDLGAFHSAEILFVFGNSLMRIVNLSVEDQPLVDAMQGYWTRFAATGDPNGGEEPSWPTYNEEADQHQVLDLEVRTESGLRSDRCDFWDGIYGL
jgi:para-nitrobenzyl esterase